jgi:hypothetical protein
VHRVDSVSKSKFVHVIRIAHRDEVEAPLTDWLREAYKMQMNPKPDKTGAVPAAKDNQMSKKGALGTKGPAAKKDDGTQLKRVRLICSSIPGTIEKTSHGEPTFFTPKRVFAMFANNHHGDGHIAVWVPAAPGVQADLIEEAPDTYFRPPYVGGAGWVGVELTSVDDERLGAVIRQAFRLMTAKTIATSRSEASRPRHPGKTPRRPRRV